MGMTEVYEDIATRIRSCRKALGLTQAELARKLKLSTKAVNEWERGRKKPWQNLTSLASALGVTTDWLLTGREGGVGVPRADHSEAARLLEQAAKLLSNQPLQEGQQENRPFELTRNEQAAEAVMRRMMQCKLGPWELVGEAAADTGEGRTYDAEQFEPGQMVYMVTDNQRMVTIKGESCQELARDGQQAVIDGDVITCDEGKPCIVMTRNGELRLKRKDKPRADCMVYQSINPAYPPFTPRKKDVIAEWPVITVILNAKVRSPVETVDEGPPPKPQRKKRRRARK